MKTIAQLQKYMLLLLLATVPLMSGAQVSQQQGVPQKEQLEVVKQGVAITLAIEPVTAIKGESPQLREGEDARVQFRVIDAETQQPIKGLHPSAWIDRKNPGEQDLSCKQRINSYLQGQLAFQPEATLNAYYVITLNDKASISVIDPLNGFSVSKLITRIFLNSPGSDWVLSRDQKRLYVATPLSKEVAVIDTSTWKVLTYLPFASSPARLALQPDERYLWVGLEALAGEQAFAGISVIDTQTLQSAALIATGRGHHEFAFSDDSRHAYVSNQQDQTLSIIDVEKLSGIRSIDTGSAPLSLSYSTRSKALYAATEEGAVIVIDASGEEIARIDTGSSLKTIRFSTDGRWGFALSQEDNRVFIVDAANNRVAHEVEVEGGPDQVSFTDTFAYIRPVADKFVSMIKLDGLEKDGGAAITNFPAGLKSPNEMPGLLLSDAIVPTPEGSAVVVANPLDKIVYYYMEGMAAPMGTFKLFGRNPMAVLIVDRSLQETTPGDYNATLQLPPSGPYTVAVLLDGPAVYHCFSLEVTPNPALNRDHEQPAKLEYLLESHAITASVNTRINLRVSDHLSAQPRSDATDLQVLIYRIPGTWQKRSMATPLGNGLYQVDVTPPTTGIYQLHVRSPSLNLSFEESPSLILRARVRAERVTSIDSKEIKP